MTNDAASGDVPGPAEDAPDASPDASPDVASADSSSPIGDAPGPADAVEDDAGAPGTDVDPGLLPVDLQGTVLPGSPGGGCSARGGAMPGTGAILGLLAVLFMAVRRRAFARSRREPVLDLPCRIDLTRCGTFLYTPRRHGAGPSGR